MTKNCPCCGSELTEALNQPAPHRHCNSCGHRWQMANAETQNNYYSSLKDRNAVPSSYRERKIADRMAGLSSLLKNGMRILEIGCAEGELASRIKAKFSVHYTGVELSSDAEAAKKVLDRVFRTSSAALDDNAYDLLLAFHVLEHIPDVSSELQNWRRVIKNAGTLVVEVPKEAGHALLAWDANPEHLHQFTPASLLSLCQRSNFDVKTLSAGHFESPVYSNSLRLVAITRDSCENLRESLLTRFRQYFQEPFAVYGVGGDFHNYVKPLLDGLPITALLDSNPERHGDLIGNLIIEDYNPALHGELKVLACSIRHRQSILASLIERGVDPARIVTLEDIYSTTK